MILRRRLFQAEKKVEHAARDQYFLFTYVIYCYVCTQTLFLKRYSRRLLFPKKTSTNICIPGEKTTKCLILQSKDTSHYYIVLQGMQRPRYSFCVIHGTTVLFSKTTLNYNVPDIALFLPSNLVKIEILLHRFQVFKCGRFLKCIIHP